MAEQNKYEDEFDVFSTEDWEAVFDSADRTMATLSAERVVAATPAAVIVESLELEGEGHTKPRATMSTGGPANKVEPAETTGEKRILLKQGSLEKKKRKPCLLSISGQPSMTVALVEVTRVVPKKKPVYGVGKVPIKWAKDEAFKRLERLEETGCSVTTQGEARKDILTIVNKFATPSNRPIVVEKETLHDRKRGVMKHSFLFAQILAPDPDGRSAKHTGPKHKGESKAPAESPQRPHGDVACIGDGDFKQLAPVARRDTYVTPEATEKQARKGGRGLGLARETPSAIWTRDKERGAEAAKANLEEEMELEADEMPATQKEPILEREEPPVAKVDVLQEGETHTGDESKSEVRMGAAARKDDPKNRANLQVDFPRLPAGTWRALEEDPPRRQTDVRAFFDPTNVPNVDQQAARARGHDQTPGRQP